MVVCKVFNRIVLLLAILIFPFSSSFAKDVNILAVWSGGDEQGFRQVLDGFTAETGIAIEYECDRDMKEVAKKSLVSKCQNFIVHIF